MGIGMSKKHVEEQKLLIENFNKWINEEKCGEKEIDEILGIGAALTGVAYAGGKLITLMSSLLRIQNELTKVTDEIARDPDAPQELKNTADNLTQATAAATESAGALAKDVPIGKQLTQKAISALAKKHLGIDIDLDQIKLPNLSKPTDEPPAEPEEQPEPEDIEGRQKLGLMPRDKEDRLQQLRSKYRE